MNLITPTLRQVIAASSAAMTLMAVFFTWALSAIALPQMNGPGSPIHFTKEQASWFAALPMFLSIPGSLVVGILMEQVGPRRLLLTLTLPLCMSTAVMAVASLKKVQDAGVAEEILLLSRVLQGGIESLIHIPANVYIYEISDSRLRGTLVSLVEIWLSLAYLLCYLLGCYLQWYTLAWLLSMCMLLPAFCGLLISPESPMWLARKGRREEAKETSMLVRNSMEEITQELKAVKSTPTHEKTLGNLLRESVKMCNLLPTVLSSLMVILKEASGFAVIGMYIVYIFQHAGVGLSPCWSSVLVGLSRIPCNGLASVLVHNLPRRLVLAAGNAQIAVSMGAIGTFFFMQSRGQDVSWLWWLPLSSLIVYTIGYAGMMGPTTWATILEILPGPVRSSGFSITVFFYLITAFTASKMFDTANDLIGLHGIFWSYGVAGLLFCALSIIFIPETKRLSLQDVEDYWKRISTKTENPA